MATPELITRIDFAARAGRMWPILANFTRCHGWNLLSGRSRVSLERGKVCGYPSTPR